LYYLNANTNVIDYDQQWFTVSMIIPL